MLLLREPEKVAQRGCKSTCEGTRHVNHQAESVDDSARISLGSFLPEGTARKGLPSENHRSSEEPLRRPCKHLRIFRGGLLDLTMAGELWEVKPTYLQAAEVETCCFGRTGIKY